MRDGNIESARYVSYREVYGRLCLLIKGTLFSASRAFKHCMLLINGCLCLYPRSYELFLHYQDNYSLIPNGPAIFCHRLRVFFTRKMYTYGNLLECLLNHLLIIRLQL